MIGTALSSSHNPDEEEDVGNDADNSVGHKVLPKIKEFQDNTQSNENGRIDGGVEKRYGALGGASRQALPLDVDELEVQHEQEEEAHEDTKLIEYFDGFAAVEVTQEGGIEVFLVAEVDHSQVAAVEAEGAGEQNNEHGHGPATFLGDDRKDEDGASDHAVDQSHDGHGHFEALFLNFHHDIPCYYLI